MRVRREKLDRLRGRGIDPYPVVVARTHTLAEVRAAHPDLAPDTATGDRSASPAGSIFSATPASSASRRCARATAPSCR